MASAEIFKLLGSIGVDNGEANKKIDETVKKAKQGSSSFGSSFGAMGQHVTNFSNKVKSGLSAAGDRIKNFNKMSDESVKIARNSAVALGGLITAVGGFGIKAAGELQAINAQFQQSFDGLGNAPDKALGQLSDKFNILPNRLKGPMSQINSFFKGSGVSAKDSLSMTSDAMNVAADSAAFYDTSIEETSASLKGFLMGNYENGDAIGINTNQTKIAAAYNEKYKGSFDDLSDAAKQKFLLEYVQDVQKASGVTGQGIREMNGLENVMGNAKQAVQDLASAIGTPFLQPFINLVSAATTKMGEFAEILNKDPNLVLALAGAIGSLAAAFAAVYVSANGFAVVRTALASLQAGFAVITNPVFLVVAAIGLLATAFMYFYRTSQPFKEFVDGIVPALRDGLATAITYCKTQFEAFIDLMTGTVLPALERFKTAVGAGIVSGLAKMGTSIEGVKSAIGSGLSTALEVISGLLDKLGGNFGAIGAVAGGVVSVLAKLGIAALGITGPWGLLASVVVSFLTAWAKTGEINADGITQVFDNLGSMIQNVSGLIAQYLPTIVAVGTDLIVKLADGIVAAIPMITTVITTIINGLSTTLATLLPLIINVGVQLITALVQGFTTALPIIIQAIMTVINMLVNTLVTLLPLIINAGVQLITALINGFVQALPAIITAVTTVITTLVSTLVMLLPIIIAAGIQILMALINGIISILPQLIAAALKIIMALIGALVANLPKIIAAGIQILMALINGIISILPSLISAAIKIIIALATALIQNLPKIIAAGVQILLALINGIIQILPQLIAAGIRLIVALVGAIIQNLPKLLGAGVQLITALIKGIMQLMGQLISKGAQLAGKVISGVKDKFGEMKNAGINFVMGFVNGIKDKAEAAVQAAADMGKKAVGAVKKFLNIHSPSRVMLEIGAFTGEGFVNGIDSMQKQVQAAADGLAEAALIDPTINDGTLNDSLNVRTGNATQQGAITPQDNAIDWQANFTVLMGIFNKWLPVIAEQKQLVLDDGTLVGSTKDKYDIAFGDDAVLKDRGAK